MYEPNGSHKSKPTIGTQKPKRKEPKNTTKENPQTAMGETKRKRIEQWRTTKTIGKPVIKWQ